MPIQVKRDLYSFGKTFLIACPQCSNRASLTNHGTTTKPNIVFSCPACSSTQQWQSTYNEIRLMGSWRWVGSDGGGKAGVPAPAGAGGAEVYLWVETSPDVTRKSEGPQFRLWLQSQCKQENLWFLNREHLDFVKFYLQVPRNYRARSFDTAQSRNKIQWLEDWVKRTENKDIVLGCLAALQTET